MLENESSGGGKEEYIAEELVRHLPLDVGEVHGIWLVPDRCTGQLTAMFLAVCGGRYGLGKIVRSCHKNVRDVFLRSMRVFVAICRLQK